jgi:hypothetical protein
MRPDIDKNQCEFGAGILDYLYGESDESARLRFETHLASCQWCIDDFAMIADARFSVLEWQRTEFAHLKTPSIRIPYDAPASSWAEKFVDLVRMPVWAAAGAAMVLLIAAAFYFTVPRSTNIAMADTDPLVVEEPRTEASISMPGAEQQVPSTVGVSGRDDKIRELRPAKAPAPRLVVNVRPITAKVEKVPRTGQPKLVQAVRKPTLNSFEEDDDRSLRLADLFDEGGV